MRGAVGRFAVAMVAIAGSLLLALIPAGADQHPDNCNQNNLVLDVGKDKTLVRGGDTIKCTVSASNLDSPQPHLRRAGRVAYLPPGAHSFPRESKHEIRAYVCAEQMIPCSTKAVGMV